MGVARRVRRDFLAAGGIDEVEAVIAAAHLLESKAFQLGQVHDSLFIGRSWPWQRGYVSEGCAPPPD